MTYRNTEFTVDELGFIQTALNKVLAAAARGELDLNRLAREAWIAKAIGLASIAPARSTKWRLPSEDQQEAQPTA